MESEYEIFCTSTSADAGLDPTRTRVLTPAERTGDGATIGPSGERARIKARLASAKRVLAAAEKTRRVTRQLIHHLERQLDDAKGTSPKG